MIIQLRPYTKLVEIQLRDEMMLRENCRGKARRAMSASPTLHLVSRSTQCRRLVEYSAVRDLFYQSRAIEFSHYTGLGPTIRQPMSSKTSGGSTAADAVEQYLKNNGGWHEVRDLANATGYSKDYIRRVAKTLVNNNSKAQSRKNRNKPIIGYSIHGDIKVPGGDRSTLINLIKTYGSSTPSNLHSMSVSELQKYLRNNIAGGVVPLGNKLEFRWK